MVLSCKFRPTVILFLQEEVPTTYEGIRPVYRFIEEKGSKEKKNDKKKKSLP